MTIQENPYDVVTGRLEDLDGFKASLRGKNRRRIIGDLSDSRLHPLSNFFRGDLPAETVFVDVLDNEKVHLEYGQHGYDFDLPTWAVEVYDKLSELNFDIVTGWDIRQVMGW